MKVLHINKNCFDVFFNQGWENWGRFVVSGKVLRQTAGVPIPKSIRLFLENRYIK